MLGLKESLMILAPCMSDEEARILDELTPADVGLDTLGNKIIRFEGFTDDCWEAAFDGGKTADDLEDEIISDWAQREETTGLALL